MRARSTCLPCCGGAHRPAVVPRSWPGAHQLVTSRSTSQAMLGACLNRLAEPSPTIHTRSQPGSRITRAPPMTATGSCRTDSISVLWQAAPAISGASARAGNRWPRTRRASASWCPDATQGPSSRSAVRSSKRPPNLTPWPSGSPTPSKPDPTSDHAGTVGVDHERGAPKKKRSCLTVRPVSSSGNSSFVQPPHA